MMSRRNFLSLSAALPFARTALLEAKTVPTTTRIYIGTGSRGPGKGIMTASWNPKTGEIGEATLAAEPISPSFLATFKKRDGEYLLYCVSEVSGVDAKVS